MKKQIIFNLITLVVLTAELFNGVVGSVKTGDGEFKETKFVKQAPPSPSLTTTESSLPSRIRDAFFSGVRDFGNVIRFVPATLTDIFRNISRTSANALRRNTTVTLIKDETSTSNPSTTTP